MMENYSYLLLIPLAIEQLFYRIPGSYPYKYGISLKNITFDLNIKPDVIKVVAKRMQIKFKKGGDEKYFSFRYPPGIIGPILFVGYSSKSLTNNGKEVLKVKIGQITFVYILLYVFFSIITFSLKGIFALILCFMVIYWFFQSFCNSYIKLYEEYLSGKAKVNRSPA